MSSAKKLSLLLLAAFLAAPPARANPAKIDPAAWMARIPGGLRLSEITIPGTHDSGAILDMPGLAGTARAQSLTIAQQLAIGVRYLDIRLNYVKDLGLRVNHGPVQQPYSFDDVLNACYAFLNAHPTETIIMSIKEEVPPGSHAYPWTFATIVKQKIDANPYKWFDVAIDPYLSATRGRIVLVRRFDDAGVYSRGIPATTWPQNTTGSAGPLLHVEDHYDLGDHIDDPAFYAAKYRECTDHMWQAATHATPVYLTFTSGTFMHSVLGVAIPRRNSIPRLAAYVNPRIKDKVAPWQGHFGVTIMDLVDRATALELIDTNGRWP